jgi:hypothetical protein
VTIAFNDALLVALGNLNRVIGGEQRLPIQAPSPPAASTAARARPLAIPPEAMTGVFPDISSTCGGQRA